MGIRGAQMKIIIGMLVSFFVFVNPFLYAIEGDTFLRNLKSVVDNIPSFKDFREKGNDLRLVIKLEAQKKFESKDKNIPGSVINVESNFTKNEVIRDTNLVPKVFQGVVEKNGVLNIRPMQTLSLSSVKLLDASRLNLNTTLINPTINLKSINTTTLSGTSNTGSLSTNSVSSTINLSPDSTITSLKNTNLTTTSTNLNLSNTRTTSTTLNTRINTTNTTLYRLPTRTTNTTITNRITTTRLTTIKK